MLKKLLLGSLLLAFFLLGIRSINVQNQGPCGNSISCIKDLSGNFEQDTKGIFMGRQITSPIIPTSTSERLAKGLAQSAVLGQTNGQKHIYVDLSTQKLTAYEGDKQVFSFPVSTGKWGPTPTGDFHIWVKLRYTRMEGGEGADYYNLPNVPYVMFFYNDQVPKSRGFSLHGAYWHNNFGHPMSHGCVNMRTEDVAQLYPWANPVTNGNTTYATADDPGTLITISGTPPSE